MTSWEKIIQSLIIALLGGGGATFLWTAFKSVIAWRDSAEGREDKAVARLEQFERNCREQLECERKYGHYWRSWAGELEYALRQAGVPVPPQPPLPKKPNGYTLNP